MVDLHLVDELVRKEQVCIGTRIAVVIRHYDSFCPRVVFAHLSHHLDDLDLASSSICHLFAAEISPAHLAHTSHTRTLHPVDSSPNRGRQNPLPG